MIVVTPLALVLSVEIDRAVPDPVRVVPLVRFEHVADESVKLTGNVSMSGLACAGIATTRVPTRIAETTASRLIENPPSLFPVESYTPVMGVCQARYGSRSSAREEP
jgi:hypothetical protein